MEDSGASWLQNPRDTPSMGCSPPWLTLRGIAIKRSLACFNLKNRQQCGREQLLEVPIAVGHFLSRPGGELPPLEDQPGD